MAASSFRTQSEWANLCDTVKSHISPEIGSDAWEVLVVPALVTSPEPELLGQFYSYLCQHDPSFSSSEEQKRLSLRFRDVVLKLITLVGAPQVISALIPLAKAEGDPEDQAKTSTLNPKWQNIDVSAIHARGTHTIDTIYGPLLPKIFQTWGAHTQDFQFNELFAVYGLYLSDFEVMTAIETEVVVFTTISCTGLRGPSLWHMRGMGRLLGARGSDEETDAMRRIKDTLRGLKVAMMAAVEFVGPEFERRAKLDMWANVGDVVRELSSWGEDEQK